MGSKKKFRDTKFGKLLINVIPSAGQLIGNLLPDSGVLGMAKNLITKSSISSAEKEALLLEHVELEKEYLKDVQNARDNETARDIDPNSSWLTKNIHEIIALQFVIGWFLLLWFVINKFMAGEVTINQLVLILAATGLKDMVLLILGYLYGRSKPQK